MNFIELNLQNMISKIVRPVQRWISGRLLKIFVLLLLLFFANRAISQVIIYPPPLSPGGNPTVIQLMYGILNNTSSSALDVYMHLVCTNSGQPVADVQSKAFLLPSGITLINSQNVENLLYPVDVKYADNKYLSYGIKTSSLPPGTYEICITVLQTIGGSVIGNNCYSISIENFTSVNLLTPMNNGLSKNSYPIFSWSKVTGTAAAFSNDIYYSLKIVEINDEQSSVIAMQSNPAVFKEDEINFNLFQYPVTSHPLEPCKKYAWQIEAFQGMGINKKSRIKSEIWSFRVDCEQQLHWTPTAQPVQDEAKTKKKKTAISNHAFYYSLSSEYPNEVIDVNDTLFFQIENNYSSGANQLTYTITNLSTNQTSALAKLDITTGQGINRIFLPIQNSVIANGETGILTLYDNEKYYFLNFKRVTDKIKNVREK